MCPVQTVTHVSGRSSTLENCPHSCCGGNFDRLPCATSRRCSGEWQPGAFECRILCVFNDLSADAPANQRAELVLRADLVGLVSSAVHDLGTLRGTSIVALDSRATTRHNCNECFL